MTERAQRMVWSSRPVAFDLRRWLETAERVAASAGWGWSSVGGTREGVVALHSSQVSGLGRWTVVAAAPVAVVDGVCGDVRLRAKVGGEMVEVARFTDPFEAVEAMLRPWAEPPCDETGFRGGAIGVFGYGCRLAVERLEEQGGALEGGEPDVWFGLYGTFLRYDAWTQQGELISRGLGAWREPASEEVAALELGRWCAAQAEARGDLEAAPSWPTFAPAVSRDPYDEAFGRVAGAIASGEIYQGCLTFPMLAPNRGQRARGLFLRLVAEHPAPFASLLVPDAPVAMASSSPERFLAVHGGRATVRPMKGTRPRGDGEHEDARLRQELAASVKDRAENVMIVDLMRNDLGRVCELGTVRTPALFEVETFASVHQMTSTVEGQLRDPGAPLRAVRACFPPGSMTGAPKVSAMRLLGHLEPFRRGWYSGVHGWIDLASGVELSVVIRSALVGTERVRWHVGGGLVADSTVEAEWQEALHKCPLPQGGAWDGDEDERQGLPMAARKC